MGSKLHTQKKSPATYIETHRAFKPHRFAAQTQLDKALQPKQRAVDWQTELSRAKRFGHNLNRVQVHPNPPIQRQVTITQAKLQGNVVDEEQRKDDEGSKIQRKSVS